VSAEAAAGCIFCMIVAGDAPARVVHEGDRTLAFLDINPATRGHTLVIPRTHCTDLLDADPTDLAEVVEVAQRTARAAVNDLGAAGVNLIQSSGVAAFQTVFHLHVHVVPRYADDGIVLPWIPSPGNAEEMDATATDLRAALR
jgi:histidine triad (HIT) family protein